MKLEKSVLIVNAVSLAVGFILMAKSGFDAGSVGLLAVLMAFINFIMIIVYSANRNRNGMLTALILTGVFFTIGFSICSNTFNFH